MKSYAVVLVAVAMLAINAAFSQAQDCKTGKCVVSRAASVVVAVAEAPVKIVEHVVCDVQPVRSIVGGVVGEIRSLAQSKAEKQAAMGSCCHVGGGFNGGSAEGVGFSTSSPDAAVRRCCFYGKRHLRESGVAYGYNRQLRAWGWFACNIYN